MSSFKSFIEAQQHMTAVKQQQEREEAIRKQQNTHDWRIAIFNTFAGGVAGLITSIIFWLITK